MMKKTTKKKTAKPVRDYNNTKRREKAELNKQKIIQLYVDMLVKANGDDVPLQLLAKKSKISLRTLFRFFGDKESLNQEIENFTTVYFSTIEERLQSMSFAEYAEFTYKVFDQYEKLFIAYLLTSFGQKSREVFRIKFYGLLLEKIQKELSLPPVNSLQRDYQMRMKVIVTLLNARLWKDMRDSFDHSGAEMAASIRWLVETLLADLKKNPPK
ncbi:MAG: TetR/AcrR family transcriptional regulator [Bdellovibrionaceae bacterium]|nr:TetR/AcrR family transcriptional regulator [Pseudobdellovibrionaceae bacterium]